MHSFTQKELAAFDEIFSAEPDNKELVDIESGIALDEDQAFNRLQEKLHRD